MQQRSNLRLQLYTKVKSKSWLKFLVNATPYHVVIMPSDHHLVVINLIRSFGYYTIRSHKHDIISHEQFLLHLGIQTFI